MRMSTVPRPVTLLRIALPALAAGLLVLLVPPLATAGSKPKDGGYVQKPDRKGVYGYVATFDGKVTNGGASLIFKAKGGGKCKSDALAPYTFGKLTSVGALPSKPVKVKNGKFKLSDSSSQEGIKTTVSGKFKSKKVAKIKVTSKVKGCKAKGTFPKAKYTSGG